MYSVMYWWDFADNHHLDTPHSGSGLLVGVYRVQENNLMHLNQLQSQLRRFKKLFPNAGAGVMWDHLRDTFGMRVPK